jgi:hypothetical protein
LTGETIAGGCSRFSFPDDALRVDQLAFLGDRHIVEIEKFWAPVSNLAMSPPFVALAADHRVDVALGESGDAFLSAPSVEHHRCMEDAWNDMS